MSSRRTKWPMSPSIIDRIINKYGLQHQLKQSGFRSLGPRDDDEFLSGRICHEDLWAKIIGKLHVAGFRGKTGLQVKLHAAGFRGKTGLQVNTRLKSTERQKITIAPRAGHVRISLRR